MSNRSTQDATGRGTPCDAATGATAPYWDYGYHTARGRRLQAETMGALAAALLRRALRGLGRR